MPLILLLLLLSVSFCCGMCLECLLPLARYREGKSSSYDVADVLECDVCYPSNEYVIDLSVV